ncbi:MAG: DUF2267 domain-containing protein [Bradymonadaceae bacterium]
MSPTGVRNLDRAVHSASEWLNRLDEKFGWDDKQKTYRACKTVLHVLRDRLPHEETVQLGAQLPMVLRGMYYDGWRPSETPKKIRTEEGFLEAISNEYPGLEQVEPSRIAQDVLAMLDEQISAGEMEDVKTSLPKNLRRVWPEA